jgi:hypothetical protein
VIRTHLDGQGRLTDRALHLPDEPPRDPNAIRWSAGAMDGVMGHHGEGHDRKSAKSTAALLVKTSRKPRERTLKKLYRTLLDDDVVSYVDPMIEELVSARPDADAIHQVGRWLVTTAGHRGPVKIGLALIGITGTRDAGEIVMTLGAHDEFTLFAAVALSNGSTDPERDLWRLAKRVDGWGRIQCVERLSDSTDPEIKEWLLREGYQNSVMYEYLAYTAATTGELTAALRRAEVDRALLTSAGEIIEALIVGGPAQDISDIDDAPAMLSAYLDLLEQRAETLGDLRTATSIARMLSGGEDADARAGHGWTEADQERLALEADRVLAQPQWPDVIADGLASDDDQAFWLAKEAAPRFGIATFGLLLERLRTDPLGGSWFDAWRTADTDDHRTTLIDLARATFRSDVIVDGSPSSIGFGPEFRAHMAFDFTLQELRNHPGTGRDLISLGLMSPTIRNRNMALAALQEWPLPTWPDDALDRLRGVASDDPDERVRQLAAELLAMAEIGT